MTVSKAMYSGFDASLRADMVPPDHVGDFREPRMLSRCWFVLRFDVRSKKPAPPRQCDGRRRGFNPKTDKFDGHCCFQHRQHEERAREYAESVAAEAGEQ